MNRLYVRGNNFAGKQLCSFRMFISVSLCDGEGEGTGVEGSKRDNLNRKTLLRFALRIKFFKNKILFGRVSSCRDSSNKGSQHIFSLRNKKNYLLNYPKYPLFSGALVKSPIILPGKNWQKIMMVHYSL